MSVWCSGDRVAMKREPRKKMVEYLAQMDSAAVHAHSLAVAKRLATIPAYVTAKSLAVYVSFGTEIETHDLIRDLLAAGRQVCIPTFRAGGYLIAEIQDFDRDLRAGKLDILEPKLLQPVPVTRPHVWLVPGLAFDRNGNRLGRGKGYFDALLAHAPGVKIALAHDFQLLNEVPTEVHDVRMDFIVTEAQVLQKPKEL